MVVTWTTDEEHDIAIRSVKDQLAFYGSTPAYAPVSTRTDTTSCTETSTACRRKAGDGDGGARPR